MLAMLPQSCPTLCKSVWMVACQGLSREFSRQEYRSGLPFPPSVDLSNSGNELSSLPSPVLAECFLPGKRSLVAKWKRIRLPM